MRTAAIVPAAGRGERLGSEVPKALVELAGRTLVAHAITAMCNGGLVDSVVVAAPAEAVDQLRELHPDVQVVAGGARRQDSVRLALAALDDDIDAVLVHDAARPLTPAAVVRAVVAALEAGADAVVPVLAIADTLRALTGDGRIGPAVDRAAIRAVQTPQGFRREVLVRAYADVDHDVTDDASLVERLGVAVQTVAGDPMGFKVTTAFDLLVADALLAYRPVFGGIGTRDQVTR